MALPLTYAMAGGKDVDRELAAMGKEFGPKNAAGALRTTLRKVSKPMERDMEARTPPGRGVLKAATGIRVRVDREGYTAVADVGWLKLIPARSGKTDEGQVRPRAQAALGIEFGNKRQSAKPVLVPVLNQHAPRIVGEFAETLRSETAATRRRLERRRRRGSLRVR